MVAFVASTVLTAANLNSAFNALTIRTVTGTSDTLVLADNGGAVTYDNASATTSTIPPFSSVAYAVGTKIVLANLGAGVVTVTAGAGVTVNGTLTIAQNAGGTCLKTATNTWQFLPFGSAGAATLTSADVSSTTGSPTITTSGIYTIYQFTGSGTIVLGKAGLCDVLVVGGGGAGADEIGGGGGAGGMLVGTSVYLQSGTNTCTVGAGGAGFEARQGFNGGSSRVGDFYGVGGGGGGSNATPGTGNTGGSGGGGGGIITPFAGGVGISGQGNNGGAGNPSNNAAGGGGGAGAVGVTGTGTVGGAGGAGVASSITGSSVTYAGGGGGEGTTPGAGGAGGGGAGTSSGGGTAGSVNTGGGGGGNNSTGTGGAGGSGIVIVRVVT